jgi:hypothetical protein
MLKFLIYFYLFGLWNLFTNASIYSQKLFYVGIPNSKMNYYSSVQQKPKWCWAASIQMLLNYYQVDIDQKQIVERTYGVNEQGESPDYPASIETVQFNLNHTGFDKKGRRYIVTAKSDFGPPIPQLLIDELSQKRPVVIGYQANFGGHIVLITAVSYYETPRGPLIRSIVVRDPMPELNNVYHQGRIEYEANTLASRIQVYWFVRVFSDIGN